MGTTILRCDHSMVYIGARTFKGVGNGGLKSHYNLIFSTKTRISLVKNEARA